MKNVKCKMKKSESITPDAILHFQFYIVTNTVFRQK
jgi:hypothetical protein